MTPLLVAMSISVEKTEEKKKKGGKGGERGGKRGADRHKWKALRTTRDSIPEQGVGKGGGKEKKKGREQKQE